MVGKVRWHSVPLLFSSNREAPPDLQPWRGFAPPGTYGHRHATPTAYRAKAIRAKSTTFPGIRVVAPNAACG